MKRILLYSSSLIILLSSCSSHEQKPVAIENTTPKVTADGANITFPTAAQADFFATETIGSSSLTSGMIAPAKVSATVTTSQEGAAQNIVLFENPDLSTSYTALLQSLVSIQQKNAVIQQKKAIIEKKKIEVDRFKDLAAHGAGTGKDVADAQVDLMSAETDLTITESEIVNAKTAITEYESKLKTGGFNPLELRRAAPGSAYIVCDIPESEISRIKEGSECSIVFTSFPNEKFTGKIDDIADMIDATTRMVKLRIVLNNAAGKFKAGMFATVYFGISEGTQISVSKNSLITVQAKNYVFVKKSPTEFIRQEVNAGSQVGDRFIIYAGVQNGDSVAVKGVMQLKGLSFGY